jgi:ferredoxin
MPRQIIQIDESKCTGCGQCILACRESAIGLVNGKAKLMRKDHCDGLGLCLPVCLSGAISFIPAEDDTELDGESGPKSGSEANAAPAAGVAGGCPGMAAPQAVQWPLQIKLTPPVAPYYDKANLLIAADCCAYSYPNFYDEFVKDSVRVIGCPKLDEIDYTELLSEIIAGNDIASVTIARMEVPCCDGIASAASRALRASAKEIPVRNVVFSVDGRMIYDGE